MRQRMRWGFFGCRWRCDGRGWQRSWQPMRGRRPTTGCRRWLHRRECCRRFSDFDSPHPTRSTAAIVV